MNFEEMTDQEIIDVASPIMDNLMEASTEIDHARHVEDFTDRIKKICTEEYLQKVCERYQSKNGFFSDRELVAVFKRPDAAAIIWKQFYTKAKGEFVAEMLLVHNGDKFLVDHVMVF